MGERKIRGEPVSDEQLQAWADEAEGGYDASQLPGRHRGDRRRWRHADRSIAAGAAAALAAYAFALL